MSEFICVIPFPEDDPAAVMESSPTAPPQLRRPLFQISIQLEHVNPEVLDLVFYGGDPPNIMRGEQ